jgi:fatty acid desaturase
MRKNLKYIVSLTLLDLLAVLAIVLLLCCCVLLAAVVVLSPVWIPLVLLVRWLDLMPTKDDHHDPTQRYTRTERQAERALRAL